MGVNYPWFDYGWDFGLGPPAWRGARTTPRWYGEIDQHLRHFRGLGISVVRWFVLADGLTYGTDGAAPRPDPVAGLGWRFDPPPLTEAFLQHFDELLARFAATGGDGLRSMQLLPMCGRTWPAAASACSIDSGWPTPTGIRSPSPGHSWLGIGTQAGRRPSSTTSVPSHRALRFNQSRRFISMIQLLHAIN